MFDLTKVEVFGLTIKSQVLDRHQELLSKCLADLIDLVAWCFFLLASPFPARTPKEGVDGCSASQDHE